MNKTNMNIFTGKGEENCREKWRVWLQRIPLQSKCPLLRVGLASAMALGSLWR